jgi:hypothetical protein
VRSFHFPRSQLVVIETFATGVSIAIASRQRDVRGVLERKFVCVGSSQTVAACCTTFLDWEAHVAKSPEAVRCESRGVVLGRPSLGGMQSSGVVGGSRTRVPDDVPRAQGG